MATVLIVDDEAEIRRLLRTILEEDGHEVVEADDVPSALAALEPAPDCIFLDVHIPGGGGTAFLAQLRVHPELSRTPAMLVTGSEESAEEILNGGLTGPHFVTKPFRAAQIFEAVRIMQDQRRNRLDLRVRVLRDVLRVTVDGDGPRVAKNLSLGGVLVASKGKRPIGDQASLVLHFRNQELKTEARVTHCRGDGIGFAFVCPPPPTLQAISSAIDDLLTDGAYLGDRRQSTRVPVSVALAFSDGKDRTLARVRDLSGTGAYVVTPDPPAIGSSVYVYLPGYAFSDGGNQRSEVRGCVSDVIRHGDDGFGCTFRNPSAEFRMAAESLRTTERADEGDDG